MRLDANTLVGRKFYAYLDGKKVDYAIWADDETGEVAQLVFEQGVQGLRPVKDEQGKSQYVILKGTITFVPVSTSS